MYLIKITEAQLTMNLFIFWPEIVNNSNLTVSGREGGKKGRKEGRAEGKLSSTFFLNCRCNPQRLP